MSLTRRNALTGAAAAGVGVPLLAACGSNGGSAASEPTAQAGETLGPATDVPVGGGKIYADQKIVVIRDWENAGKRLKGTAAILILLARLAEEGEKAAA